MAINNDKLEMEGFNDNGLLLIIKYGVDFFLQEGMKGIFGNLKMK